MSALTQLQNLLRDLFQLDMADLDFGLYRLLRLKQGEVEAFLNEQLPRRVEEAFQSMAGEEQEALQKEVSSLADRVCKEIAEDALLPNGEISPQYQSIKVKAAQELLQQYQVGRSKLHSVQASEAQMAEVFNHLYSFFSRYYDSGDFIPRRRYGANETYAVPYRGEEVFFHWANRDQHYVKTAENFRDYSFTVETLSGPSRVRFALTEASVPPGNLKGDTRYFFPLPDEAAWDKDWQTLRLPFHYRLPTEKEVEKYGKNSRFQEAILQEAAPKTLRAIPDANTRAALSTALDQKEDREVSLLLKRLRHFCRRNTSDYFVHKDLDEATDGVLIHGENYQALRLLERKYAGKIKCIYIDPPYNTGNDEFIYKDRYRHSSWVAMMEERLTLGGTLLADDGVFFVSIDEHELGTLLDLLDTIFGTENHLETIVWKKSYGGGAKEKGFIKVHEYILAYCRQITKFGEVSIAPDPTSVEKYYKYKDEKFAERGPYRLKPLEATRSMEVRPNLRYPIISSDGEEIWPERQWWWAKERTERALKDGELVFTKSQKGVTVSYKQYLNDEEGNVRRAKPFSIIDGLYTQNATREIVSLFGDGRVYSFPKPSGLIVRLVETAFGGISNGFVVDFTAGSGTTAQAVMAFNRGTTGNLRFILVEMADYFDTVLLPRIQKVMYAAEWEDGKPARKATREEVKGTARLVKVLRLFDRGRPKDRECRPG